MHRAAKGDVGLEGQIIEVDVEEGEPGAVPDPDAPLTVVFETNHVLVLDKPAGQPTAPLEPGEKGSLANALLARFPEVASCGFSAREPGLCHRLDTDTSGLVLAARDPDAFRGADLGAPRGASRQALPAPLLGDRSSRRRLDRDPARAASERSKAGPRVLASARTSRAIHPGRRSRRT